MSEIDVEFDPSDLRVNFSEEEASSEAREFTPVPSGTYLCAITDVETRFSKSEKNNGKPYWAVTLTVQNGTYADRKFWANVMLFEGALYTLAQLLKAIGREDALSTGQVPHPDELLGQQVTAVVRKQLDTWKMSKLKEAGEENPTPEYKNEVTGFKPANASSSSSAGSGKSSLLP